MRSAMLMALDPDRQPPGPGELLHGVLASQKGNLSSPPAGLRYTVRPSARPSICRLEWTGQSPRTVEELLRPRDQEELNALQQAVEWLRNRLQGGPREASDCEFFAGVAGITEAALRRAKEHPGVQSVRDGKRLVWRWRLPE